MFAITRTIVAPLALAVLALGSGPAAALSIGAPGLQVSGSVDLDGFGGQPPLSSMVDSEVGTPFARSVISVLDATPNLFSYLASSDIGNLALKAAGSVTNDTGSPYAQLELGLLRVQAEAADMLTLNTTMVGTFPVTMELVVSGVITPSADPASVAANTRLSFGVVSSPYGSDFGAYTDGIVADTLSVTRDVTFAELSSTVDMNFYASLLVNIRRALPGETVSAQLNNTALLRLILPAAVGIAGSGSGTYGSVIAAVPEPQEYALMLAGLALVSWVARRRHRAP